MTEAGSTLSDRFKAYKLTNCANGKAYIGITTQPLKQRWRAHINWAQRDKKGYLADAIREYGMEVFVIEHIASAQSWEALCLLEQLLIIQDRTFRDDGGYNLTFGGQGTLGAAQSDARRAAHIARITGVPKTPECRAAISASKRGSVLSVETRERLSAARKGKPRSASFKQKISEFWKGRPRTAEHCAKIRLSKLGTTATAETRSKMSAASKGRPKTAATRANMSAAQCKRRDDKLANST